ncbi:hypothetical protein ACLK2H_11730 [Escherichia coli]
MVQTKDAVLIADRNAVQDVKKVVERIKADGRHEHHIHRAYCPWGKYDSIDSGDRYQVKRITVKPGEAVAADASSPGRTLDSGGPGTAKATLNDEIKPWARTNLSTFRLASPTAWKTRGKSRST